MDRADVVAYRMDDGRKLLDRLMQDGLEVSAAFWMYTNDIERWRLYIASESVNKIGLHASYMIVVLAQKAMPELRIDSFEVSLLNPKRPLAAAMIRRRARIKSFWDCWGEGVQLNGVYVEMAYLYPIPTADNPDVAASGPIEGSTAGLGR